MSDHEGEKIGTPGGGSAVRSAEDPDTGAPADTGRGDPPNATADEARDDTVSPADGSRQSRDQGNESKSPNATATDAVGGAGTTMRSGTAPRGSIGAVSEATGNPSDSGTRVREVISIQGLAASHIRQNTERIVSLAGQIDVLTATMNQFMSMVMSERTTGQSVRETSEEAESSSAFIVTPGRQPITRVQSAGDLPSILHSAQQPTWAQS